MVVFNYGHVVAIYVILAGRREGSGGSLLGIGEEMYISLLLGCYPAISFNCFLGVEKLSI